ncbi:MULTISPECIES: DUF45 domain-containing protein [unclassified Pseudoalteromonas]|uniref:M61 family metallopeptidase n=1 Tax=unclassified Pseudoalteromonas TaxID=194690 RepID=UPI002097AB3B|nr:DUF45 domain-containing protein [Pseudoalteromonas sp. XMcav2-N]MCO7186831.1 DUF45 domain-containing protein [Pseudoalteromonas sp. XMcav2-N]
MRGLIVAILLCSQSWATEVVYQDLHVLDAKQQAIVKNWLSQGLKTTEQTLGPLAQSHLPVKLQNVYLSSEPVPWGAVNRSEVDGIELHISYFATQQQLISDWTLYHELAHLYHPLLDYPDFWLAEGLATYLQNVIMLHGGVITTDEYVQRIMAGLERGRLGTWETPGPLARVSEDMWRLRAHARVYWSGAAFFIEADLALRQKDPALTLVSLLKRYQTCCRAKAPAGQPDSAKAFLGQLDRLSRSSIFSNLYHSYKLRQDFPRLSKQAVRLSGLHMMSARHSELLRQK